MEEGNQTIFNGVAKVSIRPLQSGWDNRRLNSNLQNGYVRFEVGIPSEVLFIYDHRPSTLEAVEKILTSGKLRDYMENLKDIICQPARVIVSEKKNIQQVTLLPTSEKNSIYLFSSRILLFSQREKFGFEFLEQFSAWPWIRTRQNRKEISVLALISVTNESKKIVLRTWGKNNGNRYDKEIITIGSNVTRVPEEEYFSVNK